MCTKLQSFIENLIPLPVLDFSEITEFVPRWSHKMLDKREDKFRVLKNLFEVAMFIPPKSLFLGTRL